MYSNGRRQVPDIAANSDPSTGYAIYCTVPPDCSSSRPWIRVGGTSAAAPFWAAAAILVNQYVGKRVISGPRLYQLASQAQTYPPFHDITSGNNLYYPATGGYDLATGLGTPDIFNLARDLAVTLVAPGLSLALNPAIVLTNSPATLSFNLTNPNGQALTNVSFSLNLPAQVNVAAVPGISNSCGGGTISAGGSNGTIAVSGVGLAANQSCTISLKISSATPGSWYISMAGQIMANESPAGNATNGVTLKVVAPVYASYRATPGGTFVVGATPVGQAKAATFTISNGGDPVTSLSVALSGAGLSGANANEFSLSAAPSFPVSLAGGQSQTVTVGCNPTVLGTRTAKLTLNTNDSNLPVVTYNLICVGAYVVTVASDDGSGTQPGTLSYVLVNQANSSGQGVTFNLGGTNNTIAVKGVLPKVPAGVTLDGGCNNGKPGIVLDGSAIPTALPDGLVLNGGNNLIGLQVTHFKGRQIVAGSNRNQLRCVVANK